MITDPFEKMQKDKENFARQYPELYNELCEKGQEPYNPADIDIVEGIKSIFNDVKDVLGKLISFCKRKMQK